MTANSSSADKRKTAPTVRSGSGMSVRSRPATPEEVAELVALKKRLLGSSATAEDRDTSPPHPGG